MLLCKRPEEDCTEKSCFDCNQKALWDKTEDIVSGGTVSVIEYCLEAGFDVNKNNGIYGAQCLWELTLSMPSNHLIRAIKILFDAGAQNLEIEPGDEDSTPWSFIATEGSYQDTCVPDHYLGNIYEAAYQMYDNQDKGRPYGGIDTFETVIGKKLIGVLADKPEKGSVFYRQNVQGIPYGNSFNNKLYFIYEGGVLVVTEYVEFWTDRNAPYSETVDVSKRFRRILNTEIEGITFQHHSTRKGSTIYGRPIAILKMGNGKTLRFTDNFGDVSDEKRAAHYNII